MTVKQAWKIEEKVMNGWFDEKNPDKPMTEEDKLYCEVHKSVQRLRVYLQKKCAQGGNPICTHVNSQLYYNRFRRNCKWLNGKK